MGSIVGAEEGSAPGVDPLLLLVLDAFVLVVAGALGADPLLPPPMPGVDEGGSVVVGSDGLVVGVVVSFEEAFEEEGELPLPSLPRP